MSRDTSEEGMQVDGHFFHRAIVDDPLCCLRLCKTCNPTRFGSFMSMKTNTQASFKRCSQTHKQIAHGSTSASKTCWTWSSRPYVLTREGVHNVAKVVQQPTMSIRQDGTYGHAAPFVRCCDLRASSNQEQEKCFSVNTRDGPGCSRQHMVLEPL